MDLLKFGTILMLLLVLTFTLQHTAFERLEVTLRQLNPYTRTY